MTARELAGHGAKVIVAVRNTAKGERAAAGIRGLVEVRALDLQDLSSVRLFADGIDGADILINNAGIMAVPYSLTKDARAQRYGRLPRPPG